MREVQASLTLCIFLRCFSASGGTQGSKYENPNVIRVNGSLRPTLQIPLDINIKTDSELEQCQPKTKYYFILQNQMNQQQEPTASPHKEKIQLCRKMKCNGESEQLENFKTPVEFLITREMLEPIGQLPDGCGLIVGQSSLEFKGIVQPVGNQSYCTLPDLQPSIRLNANGLGHTLMFNLKVPESSTFP